MYTESSWDILVLSETGRTPHITMQYSVLLLCFFCYLLRESHGDEDIESELLVSTALGSLSGSYFTSRSGRPFVAFRGIPYAKPPVDDLRFKVH